MKRDLDNALGRILTEPVAVESEQRLDPPNEAIVLHSGFFALRQGGREIPLEGEIALHWLPEPEVRFRGVDKKSTSFLREISLDPGTIRVARAGLRGGVLLRDVTPEEEGTSYSGFVNRHAVAGSRRPVREVRFQLLNFPHYLGSSVRFATPTGWMVSRSRLEFKAVDWVVTVDQLPDCHNRIKQVRVLGGFATTHVCAIRREDGRSIAYDEAEFLLGALHLFFAFLGGQWSGPVLASGWGRRDASWRQFGSWKGSPGKVSRSWLPHHLASDVTTLLDPFIRRYQDELWRHALTTVVHWYVHANAEARTTETRLIGSFIPLELLAWLVVVKERRRMGVRSFESLDTAQRITLLLSELGVPAAIPREYRALRDSNLARGGIDGPHCLTSARNRLIHPKNPSRDPLKRAGRRGLFELKELALSYLELTLLGSLGYQGHYARRVFDGWKGDDLAKVPWS